MNDTRHKALNTRRFRPFRFTLRTIFVILTIASIWMAFKVSAARRQQVLVDELSEIQIVAHYDHQHDALPTQQLALHGSGPTRIALPNQSLKNSNASAWLRRLIGDHYFQTVSAVTISTNELSVIEAALPRLKKLPNLKEILLHAPSCIHAMPTHNKAKELLDRELPNVKVTEFGIPIVG